MKIKFLLTEAAKWKKKDPQWKQQHDINKINSIFEEARKNKDILFIRFSNVDKINVNPTYRYETPLGTYAYFIDFNNSLPKTTKKDILGEELLKCFWDQDEETFESWFLTDFAFSYKYMHIFRMKNANIINTLDFVTYKEFSSILNKIEEIYNEHYKEEADPSFYEILSEPNDSRFFDKLNYVYRLKTESSPHNEISYGWLYGFILQFSYKIRKSKKGANISNRFYRALNMDAIIDYDGHIHPNEPEQSVIISTNKSELLATFSNNFDSSDLYQLIEVYRSYVIDDYLNVKELFNLFKILTKNKKLLIHVLTVYTQPRVIYNLFKFINEYYEHKLIKSLLYQITKFVLGAFKGLNDFEDLVDVLTKVEQKKRLEIYTKLVFGQANNPEIQEKFWNSSYVENNIKEVMNIISTTYPNSEVLIPFPILNYYSIQDCLNNPCLLSNFLNGFINYDVSIYNKILSSVTDFIPIGISGLKSIYDIVYYLQKSDDSFLKKEMILRCLKQILEPNLFNAYFKKSIYRLNPEERKEYIMVLKNSGAGSTLRPRIENYKQEDFRRYIYHLIKNFYIFADISQIEKDYLSIKGEYPLVISGDDEELIIKISTNRIMKKIVTMLKDIKSSFVNLYGFPAPFSTKNFQINPIHTKDGISVNFYNSDHYFVSLGELLKAYKNDPYHKFLAVDELSEFLSKIKLIKDQMKNYKISVLNRDTENSLFSVYIHHPWRIPRDLDDIIYDFIQDKRKKYTDVFIDIYKRYLLLTLPLFKESKSEIIEICNIIKEIFEFIKKELSKSATSNPSKSPIQENRNKFVIKIRKGNK